MKTKQILYLCIAGLIIAMIILSILPIWTFANYPTASAATEEEVNTDYNYTTLEPKEGVLSITIKDTDPAYSYSIVNVLNAPIKNELTININIYINKNENKNLIIVYDDNTNKTIKIIKKIT